LWIKSKIISLTFWQKIAVLGLITLIVYGSSIVINEGVVSHAVEKFAGPPADLDVYRERTRTIIEGKLLYSDVHTETPPIINYLLVPPQLLGGESWTYSAYFSFFAFLGALLLYISLRKWSDYLAFMTGLLYILSPFGLVEATFGVEDEPLITFIFLIPLVLMIHNRRRLAALFIGIGIWTKMFPILHYPVLFIKEKKVKEKILHIILILSVTTAVTAPFLMLCLDDFVWFLKFYFLGVEGRESGGISFWHFLDLGGFGVPGEVALAVLISMILITLWYIYKKDIPIWQSALLVLTVFFTFYPKIHLGYYLMPVALLLVWAAEDKHIALRCFLVYAPLILSTLFSENAYGEIILDYSWGWIAGFVLSFTATAIIIETVIRALKKPTFMDGKTAG